MWKEIGYDLSDGEAKAKNNPETSGFYLATMFDLIAGKQVRYMDIVHFDKEAQKWTNKDCENVTNNVFSYSPDVKADEKDIRNDYFSSKIFYLEVLTLEELRDEVLDLSDEKEFAIAEYINGNIKVLAVANIVDTDENISIDIIAIDSNIGTNGCVVKRAEYLGCLSHLYHFMRNFV